MLKEKSWAFYVVQPHHTDKQRMWERKRDENVIEKDSKEDESKMKKNTI